MTISDVCIKRPGLHLGARGDPGGAGAGRRTAASASTCSPNVDFPVCTVTTVLPGASVEEMETSVTKPIEDIINTVSGIDELRSTTMEGVSIVTVQFLLSKNGNVGTQEVRDKVNTILADLPDGTETPIIDKFDTGVDARDDDRRLGPARLPRGDRAGPASRSRSGSRRSTASARSPWSAAGSGR